MSRRTWTMVTSFVLLSVLLIVGALLPVPYVVYSPGPTENTIGEINGTPLIQISGHETFPVEGHLELTTVLVSRADTRISLWKALTAWASDEKSVLPRDAVYPDDVDPGVIAQQNAEQMVTSQQDGIAAALRELDIPVSYGVFVQSIQVGAPALDHLKAGDRILAVDGTEVSEADEVGGLVTAHKPGEDVTFTVERTGSPIDVTVTTKAADDDSERAVVGISVGRGYVFPFDVTITLGEDIGGPSAGTMFALGVIDMLTPGSLTGGKFIAGTGEITGEGEVKPIGGVQQKIAAARAAGATVFLVPADDCAAAAKTNLDGIQLIKISTLHGARTALQAIAADPDADVPSCTD